VAKAIRNFAKENHALVIKGGYMDGKVLDSDTVKKLADLESRDVLLAKMAGAMKANLSKAVYLLAAPLAQAARAVGALQEARAADAAAEAEASIPAAEAAEETLAEAAAE